MRYCENCTSREAILHITVQVDVFGLHGLRRKVVQFWLCTECEIISRAILARDNLQQRRIARLLCTPAPDPPIRNSFLESADSAVPITPITKL